MMHVESAKMSGSGIAALLIGAVVPFTLVGIMPTNNALLAPSGS